MTLSLFRDMLRRKYPGKKSMEWKNRALIRDEKDLKGCPLAKMEEGFLNRKGVF